MINDCADCCSVAELGVKLGDKLVCVLLRSKDFDNLRNSSVENLVKLSYRSFNSALSFSEVTLVVILAIAEELEDHLNVLNVIFAVEELDDGVNKC